jgi:hypothetical protein
MQKVNTIVDPNREQVDEIAKIMSNLRAAEGRALNLFRTRNYVELICLSDGLEHHLEQFYRLK